MLAGLNPISSLLEAIPDSREPRAKPEFLRVHLMSGISRSSFLTGRPRSYLVVPFISSKCARASLVFLFFFRLFLFLSVCLVPLSVSLSLSFSLLVCSLFLLLNQSLCTCCLWPLLASPPQPVTHTTYGEYFSVNFLSIIVTQSQTSHFAGENIIKNDR